MPITRSAKKAARVSLRQKTSNDRQKRALKDTIKKLEKTAKVSKADAAKMLSAAFATIDKTAKKGIIKKNNAARKKARLSRLVK